MDSNLEDHAADEWRYACTSRPWIKRSGQSGSRTLTRELCGRVIAIGRYER
jgi:hypothetical protein